MNIQSINEAITKAQKSNSKPYQIFSSNPIKANKGSIRKTLLDNKDLYGLKEVSQGANGVHLSAGAVEGLVELIRYNSDFSTGNLKSHSDFLFGKKLEQQFTKIQIDEIIENKNIEINGKKISTFDLTEEMNSNDSINALKLNL